MAEDQPLLTLREAKRLAALWRRLPGFPVQEGHGDHHKSSATSANTGARRQPGSQASQKAAG